MSPTPLAEQLAEGGRLVQPLGPGGAEDVVLFEKRDGELQRVRSVSGAHFVRLHGRHGVRVRLALAGDTMLGRGVARELEQRPPQSLVAPELAELTRAADLFVLNLECCISERGAPVPKAFNFRAPPRAVETLVHLGVDCVTLANNHALDYGLEALLDTFEHLRAAGISWAGAGENVEEARAPSVVQGLPIVAFCRPRARLRRRARAAGDRLRRSPARASRSGCASALRAPSSARTGART